MSSENPYAATVVSIESGDSGETALVVRGRFLCRLLCVILLVTQLAMLIPISSMSLVGLAIVVLAAYGLREGSAFGRYAAAALFGFDSVALCAAGIMVVRTGQLSGSVVVVLALIGFGGLLAMVAGVTFFSPSITAYVKHVKNLGAESMSEASEDSANQPSGPTCEECPWCDILVVRTDANRCPECDRPI